MTDPLYRAVFAERATAELEGALRYIHRDSPRDALTVARAIAEKVAQLRRFPRGAPIDPNAPVPPEAAEPRVAHASGFLIRYVFPLRRDDRDVLYVVSIARGKQPPLDDVEYLFRFMREAAGIYARARAADEQLTVPSARRATPRAGIAP